MAYHKWDAEYWHGEYDKLMKLHRETRLQITKLQDELREVKEKAKMLDVAKRPILFVQENSVKYLPDYVGLLYTVIEYKSGYNKPELLTVHNPY